MKVSTIVEAIVINGILLWVLQWVEGEQAARASYAAQEGLTFTTYRSLFTYATVLSGRNLQLISPYTLDWVQILGVSLVLIDLYYVYGAIRRIRESAKSPAS